MKDSSDSDDEDDDTSSEEEKKPVAAKKEDKMNADKDSSDSDESEDEPSKRPQKKIMESIGFIFSICSVSSLLGAILCQYALKDYAFRDLLFWTQLLYGLSGMFDLILVMRLNLKFGILDYIFVVIVESIAQVTIKLKWMDAYACTQLKALSIWH
ncbi:probable folate-biopterin transporter 2 isoform X2 [Medicago truncatula]|uniref:probable folate-biopterin transporter 2 isoform X2 n=1 Tax=Medicago truncatula TaxID=3880 RepID=UPI000D2F2C2F|nr:probable folate-biopterin transporter 2 isoform X2 [Medicago truncatula]